MSTVLVISPEPWHAHTVSKHHYAQVLAQAGHEVIFHGPPEPDGKGLSLEEVPGLERLRVLRSPQLAPGLRFLPGPARRMLESRWLRRVEAIAGSRIDTVWLFENSRFYDMRFAADRLKIYHQVDLNQDFHPMSAAATADVCFCTTDIIAERLRSARPDVHKIHHGTAVLEEAGNTAGLDAFNVTGLHATYIGNLDMAYLDVEALAALVQAHPEVNFHFVGGYSEQTPLRLACRAAANVKWWGQLPFTQMPAVIDRSDMLLVAYRQDKQRDQASPHKFMEYLLGGNVIVCSYTDEYKDKRHLVEMAEPDGRIEDVFAQVVQDLPRYNSPDRQAERRAFALDHSYEKQLGRIADIVRRSAGCDI